MGAPASAVVGRPPMAWRTRPCYCGDLLLCTGVLPLWSSDLCTRQMMNLQCGATRLHCRNAVCRVACLAWARWIGELKHQGPRPGPACDSLETLPAKEDKRRRDCSGNHLGCPFLWGLGRIAVRTQWHSGITTRQRRDTAPKGKPPDRRREACCGEIQPVPKPQDLLPMLPCSVFDFDRRSKSGVLK